MGKESIYRSALLVVSVLLYASICMNMLIMFQSWYGKEKYTREDNRVMEFIDGGEWIKHYTVSDDEDRVYNAYSFKKYILLIPDKAGR